MVNDFKPANKWPARDTDGKGSSEPKFVPPENMPQPQPNIQNLSSGNNKSTSNMKSPHHKLLKFFKGLTKKQKILALLMILVLAGVLTLIGLSLFSNKPPVVVNVVKEEPAPEPPKTEEPSRLTGRIVPIELNKLPVTAVIIENSPDARPQSGLSDAGVVFEAVAEGGITRFLALYQDTKPASVGPVRSARPYYLRWTLPFDAGLAHVGGSPEALNDIRSLPVKDLDQFANSGAYNRVSNRYAPHNVYTSIDRLLELQAKKGWSGSEFTGFERKEKAPLPTPTAKNITFNISSANYAVNYTYVPESNFYLRNLAGRPHADEKSGKQISPDVVIAMVTDKSLHADGKHTVYRTNGSGTAFIFQDGNVIQGSWSKDNDKAQLVFKDAAGAVLKLNPGQTWITVVGAANLVTYSP